MCQSFRPVCASWICRSNSMLTMTFLRMPFRSCSTSSNERGPLSRIQTMTSVVIPEPPADDVRDDVMIVSFLHVPTADL